GISCRFCERTDCNQRAAASYRFAFAFDEYTKKDCFFSPLLVHEKEKAERNGHNDPVDNEPDGSEKHDSLDRGVRRRKGHEN
ncbi:MAG: XRE family transcriptional regulator, partial [Myxococcaceae bacterium]